MMFRRVVLAAYVVAVAATGAGSQQTPAARPARPRTVGQTAYTAKSELFATVPGFVVGQAGRVGVHLSHLGERFTPFTEGKVTATLTVNGTTSTASVDKPARAGVYRVEITPEQAGTGTLTVDIAGADGSDHFVFQNIPVYPDVATAIAQQGSDPEAGAIKYTKEHSWDENEYASNVVARVSLGSGAPVLAIPRTAIVDIDGQSMVYVQRNPEAFDLRRVTTGVGEDRFVAVTDGLREGERIVTRGGAKMPKK